MYFPSVLVTGKSLKRTSVFERLGSDTKTDTAAANKVRIVIHLLLYSILGWFGIYCIWDFPRYRFLSPNVSIPFLQQVTGVFSRLGKVDEHDDAERDMADSAAAEEDDESDGEGSVLQYAGVLKRSLLPSKKQPITQKAKPVTLYRLGNKSNLPLSESTPSSVPSSTSSSQEGAPKRRILRRLGKAPTSSPASTSSSSLRSSQSTETQDSQVTSSRSKANFALASPKVSSSTGTGKDSHGAQMDATTVSVFKRLGAKRI